MTKAEKFLEFINLIHINGLNEIALVEFTGDKSKVTFYVQEYAFYGEVVYNENIIGGDVELPMFQFDVLMSMLKSFKKTKQEDIDINVQYKGHNKIHDDPHCINIKSSEIETRFILGDKVIMRNQKKVNRDQLEWDYDIKLDGDFMKKFFSYNNILKDFDHFSFTAEDYIRIHFGDKKRMSDNAISLDIAINDGKKHTDHVFFNLDFFSNILKINEKAKELHLRINKRMYCLDVVTDRYQCMYIGASKK